MPDNMMMKLNLTPLEGKVSDTEWETRVNLAAAFRVAYHFGWNQTIHNHFSARVPDNPDHFVMNPQGLGWHEITASSLITSDYNGNDITESDFRLAPAGRIEIASRCSGDVWDSAQASREPKLECAPSPTAAAHGPFRLRQRAQRLRYFLGA